MTALATAPNSSQQVLTMQGTQVQASSIDAAAFFANTRRQNLSFRTIGSFEGFGLQDMVQVLQTGIISQIRVTVSGTLTVTPGTGTVATTYQWPYNFLQNARFSANGQSNLINVSGQALKLFQVINELPRSDRGVTQAFGGAAPGNSVNQGTLSQASESWGVGSGVTALAAGSYDVLLTYEIPISYDPAGRLLGAIFAQTQSTDLELTLSWSPQASLFALTGDAAIAFNPSVSVEGTVYNIPNVNGGIVIPNLSAFHSLIEGRAPNQISNGANEITLAGQGVGRKLMRIAYRTISNGQPLQQNAANYAQPYWRFGGNTTPEQFFDGGDLRRWNEGLYDSDVGGLWGYGCFDFSTMFAQRDSVDEGKATQLRFGFSVPNGTALTAPYTEYIQQTIVAGAVAA